MSATDELRKLLDERGVKWWPMRNNGYYEDRDTEFVANGKKHTAHEWGDGFAVYNLNTKQAIAATLGRGTCNMEQIPECRYDDIECNECGICLWGFFMDKPGEGVCSKPNYCPYCGRAVKQ